MADGRSRNGAGTTAAISQKVQEYNPRVFIDRALERSDTIAIDHYPDWRGHGDNDNNARCLHCYQGDNRTWLSDGVHPMPKRCLWLDERKACEALT